MIDLKDNTPVSTHGRDVLRIAENIYVSGEDRGDEGFNVNGIYVNQGRGDGKIKHIFEPGFRLAAFQGHMLVFQGFNNHYSVLDALSGKEFGISPIQTSKEIMLSSSGRYSIHEDVDGKLYKIDHDAPDPKPVEIKDAKLWTKGYSFELKADVLVGTFKDNLKQLYRLSHEQKSGYKQIYFALNCTFGVLVKTDGTVHLYRSDINGIYTQGNFDELYFSEDEENRSQ